jgi:hypothetical protein
MTAQHPAKQAQNWMWWRRCHRSLQSRGQTSQPQRLSGSSTPSRSNQLAWLPLRQAAGSTRPAVHELRSGTGTGRRCAHAAPSTALAVASSLCGR